jgi:Tol biopolymer transport system component
LPRRGDGYNAVWSPDGTRIAFEGIERSGSGWRTIYVVGADGTGLRTLPGTSATGGLFSGNLTWSPDGTQIVFAGRTGANPHAWLYAVSSDGLSAPRPLRVDAGVSQLGQPTWSPDGSRIAFSAYVPSGGPWLYVMHADGSNLRRVAGGHGPVWSPDSSMLAFRGVGNQPGNQTVDADGTHPASLGTGSWAGLSWSPDSQYIAFAGGSGHASNGDAFVVRPNGTGRQRILHRPGAYGLPLWRHGTASTETG